MSQPIKREMKTIKEWEKLVSPYMRLLNYDGYSEMYEKLSEINVKNVAESQRIRFSDAGNLLCTRRGFISGLYNSTIEFPEIKDYEQLSNILPDYVESETNIQLSATIGQLKINKDIMHEDEIKRLVELLRIKLNVRKKHIKSSGTLEEKPLSKINLDNFDDKEQQMIKLFNITKLFKGTVEQLEIYLINKIIKYLEKISKVPVKLNDRILVMINLLTNIYYITARMQSNTPLEEEFMYIDMVDTKEPFEQKYSIIDPDTNTKTTGFIFRPEENAPVESTAISVPIEEEKRKPRR